MSARIHRAGFVFHAQNRITPLGRIQSVDGIRKIFKTLDLRDLKQRMADRRSYRRPHDPTEAQRACPTPRAALPEALARPLA